VYAGEPRDRAVLETAHLKVVPSLGHFAKGYLLAVPRVHLCALADAPLALIWELEEVKQALVRRLGPMYGDYVFFEHGARTPESGGCGISHAHLHALPLGSDGILPRLKAQFPHVPLDSMADLRRASSGASYLYFEDPSSQEWLFFPKSLPSQYMRRLIAGAAGIPEWDWRKSGREDLLLATRAEVLCALSGAGDGG
jgi:diadenosine tetraphosphate (Ap4A) HIT family hydrolase